MAVHLLPGAVFFFLNDLQQCGDDGGCWWWRDSLAQMDGVSRSENKLTEMA